MNTPRAPEQGTALLPVCFQGDVELLLGLGLPEALQAPGRRTVLQDGERHREVILDLKMQNMERRWFFTSDQTAEGRLSEAGSRPAAASGR